MAQHDHRSIPIPVPTAIEQIAMKETIRYLRRVNAQASTLMLVQQRGEAHLMLEVLRGGATSSLDFCEQLLELGTQDEATRFTGDWELTAS